MHPPAVAASRLLLGAGIGGLLAVGLDARDGSGGGFTAAVFASLSTGCLLLGWSLSRGVGPMANMFSDESDEEMALRIKSSVEDWEASEDVNAKWAALEAKVLSNDLSEASGETDASVD